MKKLDIIKQFTADDALIGQIDRIAMNQEELNSLVKNREPKIYLFDGEFIINLSYENVEYCGIKNPVAYIPSDKYVSFEARKIKFKNVEFDEKYKKIKKEGNLQTRFCFVGSGRFIFSDERGKLYRGISDDIETSIEEFDSIWKHHIDTKFPIVDMCAPSDNGSFCIVDACGCVYVHRIESSNKLEKIEGLSNIIQVESYRSNITFKFKFYAIDNGGKLYSWNYDDIKATKNDDNIKYKQLAISGAMIFGLDINGRVHLINKEEFLETRRDNIPPDLPPIKKLTVGENSVWTLSEEGKIYAWGEKGYCSIPDDISEVIDIGKQEILFTPVLEADGRVRILMNNVPYRARSYVDCSNLPNAKRILAYDRFNECLYMLSESNEVYVGKLDKDRIDWKKMKAINKSDEFKTDSELFNPFSALKRSIQAAQGNVINQEKVVIKLYDND